MADDDHEEGDRPTAGSDETAGTDERAEPDRSHERDPDEPRNGIDPDDDEPRETADTFHVVYNVAGDHIGDVGSERRRRRVGNLSEDDARDSVRGFVAPPGYADARADLLARRLAVLAGDEDTGRRCAATSLLLELPGTRGPLVVLPPTRTVDELSNHGFKQGRRYLLPDLPAASGAAAVRRHDVDMLIEQLGATESSLVVTTSSVVGRKQFGDLARPWRPVAAAELVTAFTTDYPGAVDADGEKSLLAACEALTPAATRSVLRTAVEDGLEAALVSGSATGRQEATRWFGDEPEERDIVRLALVAFVPFLDRRRYGLYLDRLRELIVPDRMAGSEALRQEFVELRQIPLIVEREREDGSGETVIRPVSRDVHTGIAEELFDRYGPELLEPVRELQDELAGTIDGTAQFGVASGMAVLARVAPAEVRQRLAGWADADTPRRRTAAFTLALMGEDDATANAALQLATSWISGAGERRAATAATAFGLALADRFPAHAVSHLWALALRSTAVSRYARQSLIALAQDSAADTTALRDLLRTLDKQMRRLLEETPRRPKQEQRGTLALSALLRAPVPAGEAGTAGLTPSQSPRRSMSVVTLREHTELAALLGALWAHVLCSRPHRGDAVRALRADLDTLEPARDTAAVKRLGAQIRRRLAPEQWQWLRRDLPGARWQW